MYMYINTIYMYYTQTSVSTCIQKCTLYEHIALHIHNVHVPVLGSRDHSQEQGERGDIQDGAGHQEGGVLLAAGN